MVSGEPGGFFEENRASAALKLLLSGVYFGGAMPATRGVDGDFHFAGVAFLGRRSGFLIFRLELRSNLIHDLDHHEDCQGNDQETDQFIEE